MNSTSPNPSESPMDREADAAPESRPSEGKTAQAEETPSQVETMSPIHSILIDGIESESVPAYTETNTDDLFSRIESLQASGSSSPASPLVLPITKLKPYPPRASHLDMSSPERARLLESHHLASAIVRSFFHAITSRHEDVVRDFVARGLVSPDVTTPAGETPLLAAVRAGDATTLRTLVALGATVDAYGTAMPHPASSPSSSSSSPSALWARQAGPKRTPLQLAAALGRLPLVKQLREEHGADDALVAPDGELALRLAARNGHGDVVAYLPARRGGAWKRWQTAHEVEMRRIKRVAGGVVRAAELVFWRVPRAVVWSFPRWMWRKRQRVMDWCVRQLKAFPGRVKRAVKVLSGELARVGRGVLRAVKAVPGALAKVGRGLLRIVKAFPGELTKLGRAMLRAVKALPGQLAKLGRAIWRVVKAIPGELAKLGRALWRVVKALWEQLVRLGQAVWRVIKATPKAAMIVLTWLWDGMRFVGGAVAEVGMRIISVLHTAVVAILGRFRTITLRDVMDGCKAVLQALFVSFPLAVAAFVSRSGRVAYEVLEAMFGCVGQACWFFVYLLVAILIWPPKQVWKMLEAAGRSVRKGVEEILVWMDPKRMS